MSEFLCSFCLVLPSCRGEKLCKQMKEIAPFYNCRYAVNLINVLISLRCVEILSMDFENDYSGNVDVSCLLNDGRVFSYNYFYGSCSACDNWEAKDYNDFQIEEIMLQEATFFDNLDQYNKWVESKKNAESM